MELKGIIAIGERKSLTCCAKTDDVLIGGVSLYDELENYFNLDAEEFWLAPYDSPKQSPRYNIRYIISDEPQDGDISFALAVLNTIYADHICGCYSEWTCGYGGFDYAVSEGRSIFAELNTHVGKYIHFEI